MSKLTKNVLIIGLGEIGSAIKELIEENTEHFVFITGLDKNPNKSDWCIVEDFNVVHICFPEKDFYKFAMEVNKYWYKICPKIMIIHSTISLMTSKWLENGRFTGTQIFHLSILGDMNTLKTYISKIYNINIGDKNV